MGKFKANEIAALPAGVHGDGDGLYIQVQPSGARSYLYRYKLNGRTREMGLGSVSAISLKDAREMRDEAKTKKAKGIDPIDERKALIVADIAKVITFRQAAERYIERNRHTWSDVHAEQVEASLTAYAYPVFGALPITSVTRDHVFKALGPLWHTKGETAKRTRQRICSVFKHAIACDEHLEVRNPAEEEIVSTALGEQKLVVVNYASLPYADIPTFMPEIRRRERISARALEITILTALRTKEAIKGRWTEVNFDDATWTIPKERMKNRKQHVVPLSRRALEILRELHRTRDPDCPFIFAGVRPGKPLCNVAMLKVLRVMGRGDLTTHGFRGTFKTWASEKTPHQHETSEFALAHSVGTKVAQAYNSGTMLEKRRALMNDWADYCAGTAEPASTEKSHKPQLTVVAAA